jgi:phage terminase small subunit
MGKENKEIMTRKTDDNVILQMLREGKTQKEIAEHFSVSPAAICKRVKRIDAVLRVEKSLEGLTDKQKKFALTVANGESATNAALSSFDCNSRDSAKTVGKELMRRDDINAAISTLMHEEGLSRRYRVKKLKGHIDHADPNVSLKGLDQSWKLDGAYAEEKHVHVVSYPDMVKSLAELQAKNRKEARALGLDTQDEGIPEAEYTEEDIGESIEGD